MYWLGVPPCGRAYFLLLRQKKVAKEKATPGYAVGCANSPALLEIGGGCGTRATPSDSPRPLSAAFSVARRSTRGPKGGMTEPVSPRMNCYGQPGKKPKIAPSDLPPLTPSLPRRRESRLRLDSRLCGNDGTDRPARIVLPGPLRGAEQRRSAGGFRFAMFEPQASSGKPPGVSSSARNRATPGTDPGSPFLCLLSFGEAKESETPRKGGTSS